MIKFDSEAGTLMLKGKMVDLESEACWMIRLMYKNIFKEDEEMGERFKNDMIHLIKFAFVSDEEIREENEKADQRNEEMINSIKDLLDSIDDMLKKEGVDTGSTRDDYTEAFKKFLHGEDEEE